MRGQSSADRAVDLGLQRELRRVADQFHRRRLIEADIDGRRRLSAGLQPLGSATSEKIIVGCNSQHGFSRPLVLHFIDQSPHLFGSPAPVIGVVDYLGWCWGNHVGGLSIFGFFLALSAIHPPAPMPKRGAARRKDPRGAPGRGGDASCTKLLAP
jgi:hypothetical protein